MRLCAAGLAATATLCAVGCSSGSPTAASPVATVIVVGAPAPPAGLPGYVIDTGAGGKSDVPLTCSDLVCAETLQIQNTGPGCATNVDGAIDVYSAPAGLNSLLTSRSVLLIPYNPVLQPGQTVSVDVSVPIPASLPAGYVVTAVLGWTNHACS